MKTKYLLKIISCISLFAACSAPGLSEEKTDSTLTLAPDFGGKADSQTAIAENWNYDILFTGLTLDLSSKAASATIKLASTTTSNISLEAAGLTIKSVTTTEGPLKYQMTKGRLDVETSGHSDITIDYTFKETTKLEGYNSAGLTLLWPYYCGNLFPCKSAPDDGLSFSLLLNGIPQGQKAVFPTSIPFDAPSYMLALAVGDYSYRELGATKAGTKVGVWYFAGEEKKAQTGTADLVKVFEWYEQNLGPYKFGAQVGSVSAKWGQSGYGGMEHHPFWHIAQASIDDPEAHAHEAGHGWYGDGVRIRCWEDFVLSEGTTSYLTARAIGAVRGSTAENNVWTGYRAELEAAVADADIVAWPNSCGKVDVLKDGLFSSIPYMKGAFFLRTVEQAIGAKNLEQVLANFYQQRVGTAASMADLLETIKSQTGFDPWPLANSWLRGLGIPK